MITYFFLTVNLTHTAVEPQKTIIIAGKSTTIQPTVPPALHPAHIQNQTSTFEDNNLSKLHHGVLTMKLDLNQVNKSIFVTIERYWL